MRKKSITLLICVYAALCISYSVIASAMAPGNDDFSFTVSQDAAKETSQNSSSAKSSVSVKEKSSLSGDESSTSGSKSVSSEAVSDNTVSDEQSTETESSIAVESSAASESSIVSESSIEPSENLPCMVSSTPRLRTSALATADSADGIAPRYRLRRAKRTLCALTEA